MHARCTELLNIRKEDVVTVSSHTLVHINIHDSNHTLSSNCFSITHMYISPLSLHSMHTPSTPQRGGVERGFFGCFDWLPWTSLRQSYKWLCQSVPATSMVDRMLMLAMGVHILLRKSSKGKFLKSNKTNELKLYDHTDLTLKLVT